MKSILLLFVTILSTTRALAYEPVDQNLLGFMQTKPNKTQFGGEAYGIYTDGSQDAGSAVKYDTRYTGVGEAFAVMPAGSKAFVRAGLLGRYGTRIEDEDEQENANQIKSSQPRLDLWVDVNMTLQSDLELFAGLKLLYLGAYTETSSSLYVSAEKTVERAMLFAPRFGVLKRSSTFSGGFYYVMGSSKNRGFKSVASDDTENEGKAVEFLETQIGGLLNVRLNQFELFFEGQLAKASESGAKSTDGTEVYRDYYRIGLGATYLYGNPNFRFTSLYKTLSYSDQEFTNADNIPLLQLEVAIDFKGAGNGKRYLAMGYAQAWDSQSQEQFNAKIMYKSYVIKYGFDLQY